MSEVVGATHEFHEAEYAEDWARRFIPTPERLHLFETILQQLESAVPADGHVVELGIGPAYLAEYLLERMPRISYEGVDFSQPMLTQAATRLARFGDRVHFQQADLLGDSWGGDLARPPAGVVSTWALHDLGGQAQTLHVYRVCAAALPEGGILLNGDFVKPDGTRLPFEPGRFPIGRHLELLQEAGFCDRRNLHLWEEEIEAPTASQNYACLLGIV
ncbi:MAG: class I SAM-dependent methyltransferase [Caldilineaceae bacterium]|nr:class I SAM-dependent methyltransferase [Caldilineaceae bacterium]